MAICSKYLWGLWSPDPLATPMRWSSAALQCCHRM